MKTKTQNTSGKSLNSARANFPLGEVLHEMIIKTGEKVTFRRWKPTDDTKEIFDLHLRSMKSNPGYQYCQIGWDKDLLDIGGNYMKGRNDFLVAEINSTIIAIAGLRERSDLGENITEFVRDRTEPKYQRNGISGALSRLREEIAVKLGFEKAYGESSEVQKNKLNQFKKEGWTLIEQTEREWMEGIKMTVYCYEKDLNVSIITKLRGDENDN